MMVHFQPTKRLGTKRSANHPFRGSAAAAASTPLWKYGSSDQGRPQGALRTAGPAQVLTGSEHEPGREIIAPSMPGRIPRQPHVSRRVPLDTRSPQRNAQDVHRLGIHGEITV